MSLVEAPKRLDSAWQGERSEPSLGNGTQLVDDWLSLLSVRVSVFPSCGEAVFVYSPLEVGVPRNVDPATGELLPSAWSQLDEEERQDRNDRRTASRSLARMRRFMVHNRLTTMWVLTNADVVDGEDGYREMQARMRRFIRRLRHSLFADRDFPYLWSIEPHPGGHGWHVNLMLQNRYIDKHQLQRLWSNGNVWYTDFTRDRKDCFGRDLGRSASGGRVSGRAGARRAASYAAKYIGKDLGEDCGIPARAHRYEVAEGFQPQPVILRVRSFADAHQWLRDHPSFGSLTWHGRSDDWEAWDGPPVEVIFFDAPARAVKDRRSRPRVAP